jgi:four helix bundle protein
MTPHELRTRTKRLAIDIIRFCVALPPKDVERAIGRQLVRAGTSVGANYRAVCRARSDKEFIAKPGLTIEEADETTYWLEILVEAGLVASAATAKLLNEAEELIRILVASRETVRRRHPKRTREPRRSITDY